jgi:hypothetical protein
METIKWVAGKSFGYRQQDFLSLIMEFSDGKLKQKGFFLHIAAPTLLVPPYCTIFCPLLFEVPLSHIFLLYFLTFYSFSVVRFYRYF